MSRLAILNPDTLVGTELKQALERRRRLWSDLRLLVAETREYATLSEVAGEAALVHGLDDASLAGIDIVFVCPRPGEDPADLVPRLAAAETVVFVAPYAAVPGGEPLVAGVSAEPASDSRVLISPHAGAVALAHLLHPLRRLGLARAVGWVVEPASAAGQPGVDELLDQTRGVLAFAPETPQEVFGRRVALNLFPTEGGAGLAAAVRAVLGGEIAVSVDLLRAGLFHSVAVGVQARCAAGTTLEDVRAALAAHPRVELAADDAPPGPVEAAGAEHLLATVRPDAAETGGFWLWGVLDNLTVGGAANALAIVEPRLGSPVN